MSIWEHVRAKFVKAGYTSGFGGDDTNGDICKTYVDNNTSYERKLMVEIVPSKSQLTVLVHTTLCTRKTGEDDTAWEWYHGHHRITDISDLFERTARENKFLGFGI